jgi:hypothetical protein
MRVDMLNNAADSIKNLPAGFLDKIMMIERLSDEGKRVEVYDPVTGKIKIENGKPKTKEIYGAAAVPIWLVRLLFILIEITPVILKLFLIKSSYDFMQENVTQILIAKQGIIYREEKNEHNKIIYVQTNFNADRIASIIQHQNKLEDRNAKEAITAFADKELEEIKKNPQAFFPNSGGQGSQGQGTGNSSGSGSNPSGNGSGNSPT